MANFKKQTKGPKNGNTLPNDENCEMEKIQLIQKALVKIIEASSPNKEASDAGSIANFKKNK